MSKTANSSIHHFENYIQIQKLKCILKLAFKNDTLTTRAEKMRQSIPSKQNGALEFTVRPGYSVFTQRG